MTSPSRDPVQEIPPKIAVIGAGVAGLVCAKTLVSKGYNVVLYEQNRYVGGRVATDRRQDGYLIDRGFQILIRSYPEIRRQLDLKDLDLKSFGQGAVLVYGTNHQTGNQQFDVFANPLTEPWYLLRTIKLVIQRWGILSTIMDVMKLICRVIIPSWVYYFSDPYQCLRERWGLNVRGGAVEHLQKIPSSTGVSPTNCSTVKRMKIIPSKSTKEFLESQVGLSSGFYSEFLNPFFQAIYVSPISAQHPGMFEFVLRMLAVPGSASIPRGGMQAIPEQLLSQIENLGPTQFKLSLNQSVSQIERRGKGYILTLGNGKSSEQFDRVVIATEWPSAIGMMDTLTNSGGPSTSYANDTIVATASETWYFSLPERELPVKEALIVLNGNNGSSVENCSLASSPKAGPGLVEKDLSFPLLSSENFRISNIGFPSVVQRSYAPQGFHQCAVTVMCKAIPGEASTERKKEWPDEQWVRNEIERLLLCPKMKDMKEAGTGNQLSSNIDNWKLIDRKSIPFHQPSQAPDLLVNLLLREETSNGVYFCGDWKGTPTLDGAMLTGRLVGERISKELG